MTFQDLGALGEIISGVAVLVTLVYLAIQTRQSRIAAQETAKFGALEATHSIIDLYSTWRSSVLANPEHTDLLVKANSGAALTEAEQLRVSLLFHDLFYAAAYSYHSAAAEGSFHDAPADIEYFLLVLNDLPCAVTEWHRLKHNVSKMNAQFVTYVDDALARNTNDA